MAAFQLFQLPLSPAATRSSSFLHAHSCSLPALSDKSRFIIQRRKTRGKTVRVGKEDLTETQLPTSSPAENQQQQQQEPDPQDLEYVRQIQKILELLRKNRDMLFSEVKLTVMIEDPREVERRRLLGIEDPDAPTREDLAEALEQVNEGKIPESRVALQMLAEEMMQWPNLEVEAQKKKRSKSLYAKATDTGVKPDVAAKRLNIYWDSAAEIDDVDAASDEAEVPPAVGYGALYLVTAFPVIIEPRQVRGEEANILERKESLEKEKQILVDPISLQGSAAGEASFSLMLSPPGGTRMRPAANTKFVSYSLPNSTSSSPRFSSILSKKKWKNESQASPRQVEKLMHLNLASDESFGRSKSCGEGRASAPTDELDLWMHKPTGSTFETHQDKTDEARKYGSGKSMDPQAHGFKCSALCLYLPGFGKGKPVRARKEDSMVNAISRRVSLEKFECGSWASSAIVPDEEVESMNMYFDLPMELIRSSANEAHSPVSAAFVFDKDIKGVLKNCAGSNTGRKCNESPRQVRFSTSLPASPGSCITPRLRKAREDFNAFLEAQSAS